MDIDNMARMLCEANYLTQAHYIKGGNYGKDKGMVPWEEKHDFQKKHWIIQASNLYLLMGE